MEYNWIAQSSIAMLIKSIIADATGGPRGIVVHTVLLHRSTPDKCLRYLFTVWYPYAKKGNNCTNRKNTNTITSINHHHDSHKHFPDCGKPIPISSL